MICKLFWYNLWESGKNVDRNLVDFQKKSGAFQGVLSSGRRVVWRTGWGGENGAEENASRATEARECRFVSELFLALQHVHQHTQPKLNWMFFCLMPFREEHPAILQGSWAFVYVCVCRNTWASICCVVEMIDVAAVFQTSNPKISQTWVQRSTLNTFAVRDPSPLSTGKKSVHAGASDDDGEPNTYDRTDSFLDDGTISGEDSSPFDPADEDSDFEPEEEDIARLKKEARGFLRNKKMAKPTRTKWCWLFWLSRSKTEKRTVYIHLCTFISLIEAGQTSNSRLCAVLLEVPGSEVFVSCWRDWMDKQVFFYPERYTFGFWTLFSFPCFGHCSPSFVGSSFCIVSFLTFLVCRRQLWSVLTTLELSKQRKIFVRKDQSKEGIFVFILFLSKRSHFLFSRLCGRHGQLMFRGRRFWDESTRSWDSFAGIAEISWPIVCPENWTSGATVDLLKGSHDQDLFLGKTVWVLFHNLHITVGESSRPCQKTDCKIMPYPLGLSDIYLDQIRIVGCTGIVSFCVFSKHVCVQRSPARNVLVSYCKRLTKRLNILGDFEFPTRWSLCKFLPVSVYSLHALLFVALLLQTTSHK